MKKNLSYDGGFTRPQRSHYPGRILRKVFLPAFICSILFFLTALQANAQNAAVSGIVTDDKSETLPGVNVRVKGTTIGTTTDVNGKYTISVPTGGTLIFSFIGYTDQEVIVGSRTNINIQLTNSSTSLNEVVVVGYGTQQKKDLTGAVSIVRAKDIQKRQATTVAEALQGQASGIKVRGGGQPGSEAQIQIRGLKNLGTEPPLYVVDGLITTANRDFNPNDIESVQILIDASAAAIYG